MRLFVDFIPVIIWGILVVALIAVMLLASWVLRPHLPQSSDTVSTYECGENPIGPARISYPYNYIVYTVLFVIVDVLSAFLFLVAVSPVRFSPETAWAVLSFIGLVMISIGYALKMMPRATLSGGESVRLYRLARQAAESTLETGGKV
ncbi:MAG: NADH-quinone oxidoreductase subunit A [Candidatus Thorarchaeota archaeon]